MSYPLRVLVVEDRPMEAELIRRTLLLFEEILGAPEIIVTNTLVAAIEFVKATKPIDIVILDPHLDDSDMSNTIKNIRLIEDHAPTFILTGHSRSEVERLLRNGHDSHIPVVQKGPEVYERGFLSGIVASVMTKWHARRHLPMREAMKILEGYQRPTPPTHE